MQSEERKPHLEDTVDIQTDLRNLENSTTASFLGREFLTWLWYTSEKNDHKISLQNLGDFSLFVDDRLVLSSAGGNVQEHFLKGQTPGYSGEACLALISGKLVQEAKFMLQHGQDEWIWTMKANDLSVRGLRLPGTTENDQSSHMSKRLSHVQTLLDVLDSLFQSFVSLRLSQGFERELEDIGQWLDGKQQANGIPF